MLEKYRKISERFLERIVGSDFPLNPNVITLAALPLSALAPAAAYWGVSPIVVAGIVSVSAFLDMLDGYVARRKGAVSAFGSLLDSTTDRVCDVLYTSTLMISGLMDPLLTLCLTTSEFLVSYVRARAESLGVQMRGVGLMERGERTIMKVLALAASQFYSVAGRMLSELLLVLTAFTVVQRVYTARKMLE